MNEPTMETLARRVDRVERETGRLKRSGVVALAVIAAVVLMGQVTQGKVAKVIEAEKFVVVDKEGKPRVILKVEESGELIDIPVVRLSNKEGRVHAMLYGGGKYKHVAGGGSLYLLGAEGKGEVRLSTGQDRPELSLQHGVHWGPLPGELRGRRINLTIGDEYSRLEFTDKTGKSRMSLHLRPKVTNLRFTDNTGNDRLWLALYAEGPSISLFDADENARAVLGRSELEITSTEVEIKRRGCVIVDYRHHIVE